MIGFTIKSQLVTISFQFSLFIGVKYSITFRN